MIDRTQRVILLIGFTIVVLILLFPPWKQVPVGSENTTGLDAGYHFVLYPPPQIEFRMGNIDGKLNPTINTKRWVGQLVVVCFVIATIGWISRGRSKIKKQAPREGD